MKKISKLNDKARLYDIDSIQYEELFKRIDADSARIKLKKLEVLGYKFEFK